MLKYHIGFEVRVARSVPSVQDRAGCSAPRYQPSTPIHKRSWAYYWPQKPTISLLSAGSFISAHLHRIASTKPFSSASKPGFFLKVETDLVAAVGPHQLTAKRSSDPPLAILAQS